MTSRPEYLLRHGDDALLPKSAVPNMSLLQKIWIVPFGPSAVQLYIEEYCRLHPDPKHPAKWCISEIKSVRGLQELVSNPFVLTVVVKVLPELHHSGVGRLRRSDVYEQYIAYHFRWENRRLKNLFPDEDDMTDDLRDLSMRLATAMYRLGISVCGRNTVLWPQAEESTIEKLTKDATKASRWKALLSGCPVRQSVVSARAQQPQQVEFFHNSLLEYLVANEPIDASTVCSSCLNLRTLDDSDASLIQFLADRAAGSADFTKLLQEIVQMSREDANISCASANAMTVLTLSQRIFNDCDFHGVRIPGAILRGAAFFDCHFDDAQLAACTLLNTTIVRCTFRNTDLRNVIQDRKSVV